MQTKNAGTGLSRRRFIALGTTAFVSAGLSSLPLYGCAAANLTDADSDSSADDNLAANSTDNAESTTVTYTEALTETIFVFDTVVRVMAYCSQSTLDGLRSRCKYFESILSPDISTSDISRVNAAAGATVTVAAETAELITAALAYCAKSDGLFDITIGGLTSLWDFDNGVLPEDAAIQAALPHVDYRNVLVSGNTVTLLDPEAKLDLGGIGKGFMADKLGEYLRENGCDSALINLGGTVYALGSKPNDEAWVIGIQDPNNSSSVTIASARLMDAAVVNSGIYVHSFVLDDVCYFHILDPRTGYPVNTDLVTASVMSSSASKADAYSTILLLEGYANGMEAVDADADLEAIVIDELGNVISSTNCTATLY